MSSTASTPYHNPKSEGTIHCSVCLQHCHLLGDPSLSEPADATHRSGLAALLWAGMCISTHRAAAPQFNTCSHRGPIGLVGYQVCTCFTQQIGLLYKDWKTGRNRPCMSFSMLKWRLFSLLQNVNANYVFKKSGNRFKKPKNNYIFSFACAQVEWFLHFSYF